MFMLYFESSRGRYSRCGLGLSITKLRNRFAKSDSFKKFKISEYLAKLQARAWLSHALRAPGQHIATRRRKRTTFLLVTLPNIHRFETKLLIDSAINLS